MLGLGGENPPSPPGTRHPLWGRFPRPYGIRITFSTAWAALQAQTGRAMENPHRPGPKRPPWGFLEALAGRLPSPWTCRFIAIRLSINFAIVLSK